jgi:small GTP-binding protein
MEGGQTVDAKIVFVGQTMVGKTCIVTRACSDEFDDRLEPTVGACFAPKRVNIGGAEVNLQMWDTAGQERFRSLAPMYYRGSVVAVLVFSVTDRASLTEVEHWAEEIKKQTEVVPVLVVVGNKIDLTDQRVVPIEEGERLAKEIKGLYCEVSAKVGNGIEELFEMVAESALRRLRKDLMPAKPKTVVLKKDGKKKQKKCC